VKVLWTEPAGDAFGHLARNVRDAILTRIEMIADFPEMYPVRQHEPYAGFRFFLVERYCISYVLAEGAIVVLAVFPATASRRRFTLY
jgi:plasmid stabilization system protein ParE